jgi:hypothetical protein
MSKSRWIEQWLLDRMRAAQSSTGLNAVLVDVRAVKLDRYHGTLRSEVRRLGNKYSLCASRVIEDTLDHIADEQVRSRRRAQKLLRQVISNTPGGSGGTDTDAIAALLGANAGTQRSQRAIAASRAAAMSRGQDP